MQFIEVYFPEDRLVIVDGQAAGKTNETIKIGPGNHKLTLSGEPNFQPSETTVNAAGTAMLAPAVVRFMLSQAMTPPAGPSAQHDCRPCS